MHTLIVKNILAQLKNSTSYLSISYCGYPIELVGTHICMWVPTYSVAIYICFNMYNYKWFHSLRYLVHIIVNYQYWKLSMLSIAMVHWSIGALVHRSIGPLVHWSIGPLVHWFIGPNLLNNMWSKLELAELGNNISNFGIWLYKLILRVIEESTKGP